MEKNEYVEICLFDERWIESILHVKIWLTIHKMMSYSFVEWSGAILKQIFGRFFKKTFLALRKEKMIPPLKTHFS